MTDPEAATAICTGLMAGRSLRSICGDEGMPDRSTIYAWLAADEAFREQYTHAREVQADTMMDDLLNIADTPQLGTRLKTKPDGTTETLEGDMIEHRRLQVDTRKWIASKLKPRKYGDAQLLKLGDAEGRVLKTGMTDTELAVRLSSLLHTALARSEVEGKGA